MDMFKKLYDELATKVNEYLHNTLDDMEKYPKIIFDSMEHSLFAGGKRLRPVMLLASHRLLGGNLNESLPLAGGLEMIHTYSLIHDDLPAMDNDDFRRGVPTNHKIFGEGIAILSGDALLNLAYEIMLDNALKYPDKLINHVKAINTIAQAAGIRGMIGGQVVDLQYEGKEVDSDTLQYIHQHKTGALFMASLKASIMLENPPEDASKALMEYGKSLGLAFQVIDDILDVVGDDKTLGKKTGSDKDRRKATYVDKYGLDKSWSIARQLRDSAIAQMETFGQKGEFLRQLAQFIVDRHH
ncbi:MAG: polyprenyl synthetase family protein [Clostridiales bacterium]|nr:polyprenyl synthetase family protein [Clostridiales bacterium]